MTLRGHSYSPQQAGQATPPSPPPTTGPQVQIEEPQVAPGPTTLNSEAVVACCPPLEVGDHD